MFVECVCNNCPGHIEFDEASAGQTVTCPHCGLETVLYVPQSKSADKIPSPSTATAIPVPKTEPAKYLNPARKPEPTKSAQTFKRDWFSIGLQFITAAATIACVVMIYNYTRVPEKIRYDVSEFKFTGALSKDAYSGKEYRSVLIQTRYDWSGGSPKAVSDQPEFMADADAVLNRLGNDGWQLVWSDGTRYIVQRPEGQWRRDSFYLTTEEKTNAAAKSKFE